MAAERAEAAGVAAIVLAAGLGKRMRSRLPKVLHRVGGRAMVVRVLQAVRAAGVPLAVVVTGNGAEAVEREVRTARLEPLRIEFARQTEQLGTGHATQQGLAALAPGGGSVLVLPGDAPLLPADALAALLRAHASAGAAVTLLTARPPSSTGYGRIVRDAGGAVVAIVEERDASPEQRAIEEIFTLACCFRRAFLESALPACRADNAQGELYLPDTVGLAARWGERVEAIVADDADAVLGVNDRAALARAEETLRCRTLARWMAAGVTVIDPASASVDEEAEIGRDCVLERFSVIEGPSVIGEGCLLGPGAHVRDSRLGDGCRVRHSVVEGSTLGPDCRIGPFAHVPPGSRLAAGCILAGSGGLGPPGPAPAAAEREDWLPRADGVR